MLKLISFSVCLFLFVHSASAQHDEALTIEITGLQSDEGKVFVALYDAEETWLKEVYMGSKSKSNNRTLTTVIDHVPPGKYAVSCFHDVNGNDKLDTGWFGIPKEPYACSRGARGQFGPPTWEDAVFEHRGEQTITIQF